MVGWGDTQHHPSQPTFWESCQCPCPSPSLTLCVLNPPGLCFSRNFMARSLPTVSLSPVDFQLLLHLTCAEFYTVDCSWNLFPRVLRHHTLAFLLPVP